MPIRHHAWFWEDESKPHKWRYWTDEELMEKYVQSVGRNCNLLLNANPNTDGLVPDTDFAQYRRFGRAIREQYSNPLASTKGEGDAVRLALPSVAEIDRLVVQEDLTDGHKILAYRIDAEMPEGGVKTLCSGTCVGHKRIEKFGKTAVKALRFVVEKSTGRPTIRNFSAFF